MTFVGQSSMAAVLAIFLAGTGHAASTASSSREVAPSNPTAQSLDQFLSVGGKLELPTGFTGSIDPTGYTLVSKSGEQLRFAADQALGNGTGSDRWSSDFGVPGGGCSTFLSALARAPDGKIYLGGVFTECNGVRANSIAVWDPLTGEFAALGGGVSSQVRAIGFMGDEVYVAGGFASAGGAPANNIARWDGSTWSTLGTGFENGVNSAVEAIAVLGDELYVGGSFTEAGGAPANYIARWDGSEWRALTSGGANGVNSTVVEIQALGGDLFVGGYFTQAGTVEANGIARWDGSSWAALGFGSTNGLNGPVHAIRQFGSAVYVGGVFTHAGGAPANNIAAWDGSQWTSLTDGSVVGINGGVFSMHVSGSDVYIGGSFTQVGEVPASNVARWNGNAWFSLTSGGVNGLAGGVGVRVIDGIGSNIYVGGSFLTAGDVPANYVARWNGTRWSALGNGAGMGLNGTITSIAVSGADVFVGGFFSRAGDVAANRVARWNGSNWSSLGVGPANGVNGPIYAMHAAGASLYVGGDFTAAGGAPANKVALWNGAAWEPLGTGVENGVDCDVFALTKSGSNVYVGGCFAQAGSVSANAIAIWNGTTWLSLGGGASNGVGGLFGASVKDLAISGSDLIVAGNFLQAGGLPANRVARWSGVAWSALIGGGMNGLNGYADSVAVLGSDVFVGGQFTQAGSVLANNVARWDGSTWWSLGTGSANGVSDGVNQIVSVGNDVFVAGAIFSAGGVIANRIVRWDGSTWFPLGSTLVNGVPSGLDGSVYALGSVGRDLYLGGTFGVAGGMSASRFTRYDARRDIDTFLSSVDEVSVVNEAVPLSASIATTGFPLTPGTVAFRSGVAGVGGGIFDIGGCSAQPLPSVGPDTRVATCVTSALPVGSHSLTARYSGDSINFIGTSNSVTQLVSAPTISISPLASSSALAGVSYSQDVVASSDSPGPGQSFTYRRIPGSGSLPPGLALDPATGELSGVPSAAGSFTFTVEAKDGSLPSVGGPFTQTRQYTINVSLQSTATSIGTIIPSPSVTGQAYTVPVTVTGQVGTPTGLVSVSDGTGANCTRPLVAGSVICTLTSFTPGTKTITAAYGGQGAFDASVGTSTHVVTLSDVAPTLSFNPSSGVGFALTPTGGTAVGSPAQGTVSITASGGSGNGSTLLGCNVTTGFTIVSAPIVPFVPGGGSGQIQVGCTLAAAPVQGALSCNVTTSPSSSQPPVFWPVECPGADAVAPTLSFSPPPGNDIGFPDGDLNGTALQSVQISASGAVGSGSTVLTCSTGSAGFAITGGATQTITATQGAVPLALSCTRIASPRSGTLTCDLASTPPGSAQASWTMSCPAGTFLSTSRVAVGTRTGVRNARVAVPVSFRGDGATVSFSADIVFDRDKLNFVSAVPLAGGLCTRLAPPNDDRIKVQAPGVATGLPLSAQTETRYCEISFAIGATATAGVVSLPVATSACPDAGGSQTRCTTSAGAVRITAVDPGVPLGTTLSISGYAAQVERTRTVSITNRGSGVLNVDCAVVGASALTLRSASPITVPAQAAGAVTVGCVLPAVGTVLSGQLSCTTNDPVRATLTYGLSCSTQPDGAPLPGDEIFDDQMNGNDRLGSSAALGALANGTEVVVLGAPGAGSDGNGRVYVLEGTSPSTMRQVAILAAAPRAQGQTGAPDEFGRAIALSADGQRIAVGAPKAAGSGTAAGPGQVWVFDRPVAGWSTAAPGPTPVVASNPPIDPPPSGGGMVPSEFGAAVTFAPDGTLLIGAPATTVSVPGIGMAYVYEDLGGGLWVLTTPLTSISPAGQGRFGTAVGAAEGMLVVGAPQEGAGDPQNFQRGAAYRIPIADGIAGAAQLLRPAANQAGDRFGASVAVRGGVVVVGSPQATTSAGSQSGAATVYRPDTNGNLVEQTTLVPAPGAQQGAGSALTTNGDIIVMGAPSATVGGISQRGRAYVYDVEDRYSAAELPLALLENTPGESNDQFGAAVAANRRQIVVGVPLDDRLVPPATTLQDIGRADPFGLDRIYRAGFE